MADRIETAEKELRDALAPLSEIKAEIVPAEATPEENARIAQIAATIDLGDSNAIVTFGAEAQEKLTDISDQMLGDVRNKDTGPAGDAIRRVVTAMRGFDVEGLKNKQGWLARLFRLADPLVQFAQKFEGVQKQIDTITVELEGHKTKLMKDVVALDRLYDATRDYYHELALYIAAGEQRLATLDKEELPALEAAAKASGEMLDAQKVRDLRAARDDLERRVHDLKLTRQVTMQSMPSIRLVQENDKGLITKINSTIANTIPLWKQQIAQALTIQRSRQAAASVKQATDLTNELLTATSETLGIANREVREQLERGIVDIETLKKANDALIGTINDALNIADEGRKKRAEAETQLKVMEDELKRTLAAAKARTGGAG